MKFNRPKRIVGIDAGFRHLGVVVFESNQSRFKPVRSYLYTTGKEHSQYVANDNRRRIEFLSEKLGEVFDIEKPEFVVAELPTGAARNARAMSAMAYAFAVVVLTCLLKRIRLEHVTPLELKRYIAPGHRKVPKETVIKFVTRLFGSSLLPKRKTDHEHIADATACVLTFLHKKYEPNRQA